MKYTKTIALIALAVCTHCVSAFACPELDQIYAHVCNMADEMGLSQRESIAEGVLNELSHQEEIWEKILALSALNNQVVAIVFGAPNCDGQDDLYDLHGIEIVFTGNL